MTPREIWNTFCTRALLLLLFIIVSLILAFKKESTLLFRGFTDSDSNQLFFLSNKSFRHNKSTAAIDAKDQNRSSSVVVEKENSSQSIQTKTTNTPYDSSRKPMRYVENQNCSGLQSLIVGENKEELCSYFSRLFPSRKRMQPSTRVSTALIRKGVLTPACILSMDGLVSGTDVRFAPSNQTPMSYKLFDKKKQLLQIMSVSFRKKNETSFIATLWPKSNSDVGIPEVIVHEKDFETTTTFTPRTLRYLSKQLYSEHLASAGSVLPGETKVSVIAHQDYYKVALFEGNTLSNMTKAITNGFKDIGGENIGNLFEHRGRLYLSARVNIRRIPHAMDGHGWREAGIFEIKQQNDSVYGKLVMQYAHDNKCSVRCDGCIEEKKFPKCIISAKEWWGCRRRPPGFTGTKLFWWSLKNQFDHMGCAKHAVHGECSAFLQYYKCMHGCREAYEIYQNSVSKIDNVLQGLVADRKQNILSFCNIDPSNLRYHCISEPLMHMNTCAHDTHPVMSSLEENKRKLVFMELCGLGDQHKKFPTAIFHSWHRHNFCFFQAQDRSLGAQVQFSIKYSSPSPIAIIFRFQNSTNCSQLQGDSTSIHLYSGHIEFHSTVRTEVYPGTELCMQLFLLPHKCRTHCNLLVKFSSILFYGILGA